MRAQPTPTRNPQRSLKQRIWLLGAGCWLFGIVDRSIALLADGSLSGVDGIQLLIIAFFGVCWLLLKPSRSLQSSESSH